MPRVSIKQLLLAGAHFGHLTRRWNPKMAKYIFMQKNGIHIIDLKKTQLKFEEACNAVQHIVERGGDILFVGTKPQARDMIREEATRVNMHYVNERWLGGMLTNYRTIRNSVKTLEELENMSTNGTYEKLHKKEILQVERRKQKLVHVLGGIRNMKRLPGALFVVDIRKEEIAVMEARKLNIPVFAITDTNTDPTLVDYPIPANDDAYKSIALLTHLFADAVEEALMLRRDREKLEEEERSKQEQAQPREAAKKPAKRRTRATVRKSGSAEEGKGSASSKPQTAKKSSAKPKKEVTETPVAAEAKEEAKTTTEAGKE
jgi:small subunit ribosomal protein S2